MAAVPQAPAWRRQSISPLCSRSAEVSPFNERSSCSYCLLVCSRSCMTESPTSNQIDISNLLQLHELSVANAGAFDRLHAYVLGAEAYAHDAGGHAAKRRPALYQFHGPRCGNLFVRTQNTPYQSILNEDLHGLCDPRWQFTAGLDSFEMRNCRAGLCQMRGQNIGCRDRVLIARLIPTPPMGDIAWAASPIHRSPGQYHFRRRSTRTVSSLMSSQLLNSFMRSRKNGTTYTMSFWKAGRPACLIW